MTVVKSIVQNWSALAAQVLKMFAKSTELNISNINAVSVAVLQFGFVGVQHISVMLATESKLAETI